MTEAPERIDACSKRIWILADGDVSWVLDESPNNVGEEELATAYVRADIADEMLAALETYIRVVDSDAFKRWDAAATVTHLRAATKGYDGEPLPTEAIRAAIAKAEPAE